MPNPTLQAIAAAPDTPANLALSELALEAAIEIERFQTTNEGRIGALGELSKALSERGIADLALVPIYDRALASGGLARAASKSDLYSRLNDIAKKLNSMDVVSSEELNVLRDFCIALHDALLTSRPQALRHPVLAQRR